MASILVCTLQAWCSFYNTDSVKGMRLSKKDPCEHKVASSSRLIPPRLLGNQPYQLYTALRGLAWWHFVAGVISFIVAPRYDQ